MGERFNGERGIVKGGRALSVLNPYASSLTFAWLAAHRDRLHTLLFGGKRLSILVVWDSEAGASAQIGDREREAMRALVRSARDEASRKETGR